MKLDTWKLYNELMFLSCVYYEYKNNIQFSEEQVKNLLRIVALITQKYKPNGWLQVLFATMLKTAAFNIWHM
jgi:hypothetical protein